jgi:hypothetical protein
VCDHAVVGMSPQTHVMMVCSMCCFGGCTSSTRCGARGRNGNGNVDKYMWLRFDYLGCQTARVMVCYQSNKGGRED